MSKPLIAIVLVLVLVASAVLYGYYRINAAPGSVLSEDPDCTVSAVDLVRAYESDGARADSAYLDRIVEVTGTVAELDTSGIILAGGDLAGVGCQLDRRNSPRLPRVGSTVRIKGRCAGSLMDVVLVDCVVVQY